MVWDNVQFIVKQAVPWNPAQHPRLRDAAKRLNWNEEGAEDDGSHDFQVVPFSRLKQILEARKVPEV